MKITVEILDASTEEPVGFINIEAGVPQKFESVREARNAISDYIEANPGVAESLAFLVEADGEHLGVVYFNGIWQYEL